MKGEGCTSESEGEKGRGVHVRVRASEKGCTCEWW